MIHRSDGLIPELAAWCSLPKRLKGCWRGFVRRVSASDIVDLGIRRKTCAEFILRPATTLSDASGSSTRAAGDNHPNS